MKTKKLLSVVMFLSFVLLFSCTKDEEKVKPIAEFTASKTAVEVGEVITFTNTSTDATSYAWSFGDGTTSTLAAPTKTYDAAGVFTVTLAATGEGGTDSYSLDITVEESVVLPVAIFTASSTSTYVGVEISFTNTSSDATSFSWDFGDQTSSTESAPVTTYMEAGTYTVTLTASSDAGTDTETVDITVEVYAGAAVYFIDASDEYIGQLFLDGSGTLAMVKDVAGMSGAGLAYDNVNEKVYFSDWYDADTPNGKIWKMNLDGTGAEAIASGILDPYGITLDVTGGKVYWADDAGNISRANLDGTGLETAYIYTALTDASAGSMRAVALDVENNKVYYYEVWEENLYVADLDGTNPSILIPGVYGYSIFIDTVNDKIYFDDQNTTGLRRADLDGTNIEAVGAAETRIYGIDIDYDANKLYWSGRDTGELYKADLDGSNVEILKTGISSPRGMFLKK